MYCGRCTKPSRWAADDPRCPHCRALPMWFSSWALAWEHSTSADAMQLYTNPDIRVGDVIRVKLPRRYSYVRDIPIAVGHGRGDEPLTEFDVAFLRCQGIKPEW
jgi:hypothetical protein